MAMLNSQMVCFFSTLHRKLGNKMADQELERSWIQSASWRCQKNEECRWGAACKTLDGIGWHQKICNHSHRIHVWYIGIYANIGGILMVNVTIYSSTMDPMGLMIPQSVAGAQNQVREARKLLVARLVACCTIKSIKSIKCQAVFTAWSMSARYPSCTLW
jgi:hypothetical protein